MFLYFHRHVYSIGMVIMVLAIVPMGSLLYEVAAIIGYIAGVKLGWKWL